jgi:hypothetical protein
MGGSDEPTTLTVAMSQPDYATPLGTKSIGGSYCVNRDANHRGTLKHHSTTLNPVSPYITTATYTIATPNTHKCPLRKSQTPRLELLDPTAEQACRKSKHCKKIYPPQKRPHRHLTNKIFYNYYLYKKHHIPESPSYCTRHSRHTLTNPK